MRDADRMQNAFHFAVPMIEEGRELRETGREIIFLPDVELQQAGVIRSVVVDIGGCQAVANKLLSLIHI